MEQAREDELVRHYTYFQGVVRRTWVFDELLEPIPRPIKVMEFAPQSAEYDWIYLTLGMSAQPLPGSTQPEHRLELLMYARQSEPELAGVLGLLAAYPFTHNTQLGAGHMIAGTPDAPVVEGSALTEFLFTPVYFEADGFDLIEHGDGTHTTIVNATPMTEAERAYALEHGWRALVEGPFIQQRVQIANLRRASAV